MRVPAVRPSARPAQREFIPLEGAESFRSRLFEVPAFPFLWHYHPELELTLIERGRGVRLVGDSLEPFGPGDLVLLGPNLPHTWGSRREDGPAAAVVVQFLPNVFGQALWASPEFRSVARLLHASRRGLSIEGADAEPLRHITARIAREQPGSPARVLRLLEVLVALTSAAALRPLSTHAVGGVETDDALIRRILQRLHRASPCFPPQARIAREFGLSPWSFSRLFQQHVRKPYSRYVNDWRVQHACRRLVESNDAISRIALDAGFRNLANFHRRFRAVKGVTPRAYRLGAMLQDQRPTRVC